MTAAYLPSPASAVPAAATSSPPPASASGDQASGEFSDLISSLLASAAPVALNATGNLGSSPSGAKSKANQGISPKAPKTAKQQPSLLAGIPTPGLPAPAAPLPAPLAQPGLPNPETAAGETALAAAATLDPVAGASAPSPTPALAASGGPTADPTLAFASAHGAELAMSVQAVAATATASAALPAVAPTAGPAPSPLDGSLKSARHEAVQGAAAPAPSEPGLALPAAGPVQPRTPGSDSDQPLAALPAPALEDGLPLPGKQPAADTELAFAARLTEQTSASAASNAPPRAATTATADAPAVPAPEPAAEAGGAAARASRLAPYKAPDKADPEPAGGALKPADSRSGPLGPAASGLAQRILAQPAAGAQELAPVAPLDLNPARAETRPQPVRELSLVIPQSVPDGAKAEAVEVRLLDSGGQVHVAVRSGDAGLNQSLGTQLGDLVTQLEHGGYRTETWRPAVSTAVAGSIAGVAGTSAQHFRGGADQEGSSGSGRGNQGGNGDDSPSRQRRDQDQTAPQWLDALGESGPPQTNPKRSTFNGIAS